LSPIFGSFFKPNPIFMPFFHSFPGLLLRSPWIVIKP
jgi:hypothetical protein